MTPNLVTLGMDVSDRYSSYCLVGADGDVLEEGRLRTTESVISSRFKDFTGRVVVEAGTHSPWISRVFSDLGSEVIVANPRRVQLIAQSTRKNDKADAQTLARLGRIDPKLLTPITHRSAQAQVDLASIRSRSAMLSARTVLINHVRGSVKSVGGRIPVCDAHYFHQRAAEHIPASLAIALKPMLEGIENLTEGIKRIDRLVLEMIDSRYPEARALQQIAGVGPLISLTFILTIGDPNRFKKSREIGPYLGLVPLQRESGASSPQLRISKTGDSYLRQMLVNGAHYILGYRGPDCDLRRWGLERASGGKNAKKRAVVAVARKLAILLHRLWVSGEVYEPLRREVAA